MGRRRLRPAADRGPGREQAGTGLFATVFGVVAFLLLLLLAVQVLVGLYTTTMVSTAALDAANEAARAPDPTDDGTQGRAATHALDGLGGYGRGAGHVSFDWTGTTGDEVVLNVQADKMTFLPASFGPGLGRHLSRTVRVRVERFR